MFLMQHKFENKCSVACRACTCDVTSYKLVALVFVFQPYIAHNFLKCFVMPIE